MTFFCSFIFHSQTFSKKKKWKTKGNKTRSRREGRDRREKREKREREKLIFLSLKYRSLLMNIVQLPVAGREIIWADLSTSQLSLCLNQSGEGHNQRFLAAERMAVIWNPNLYLRNLTPRIRPALDLLRSAVSALPPDKEAGEVEHVLDLGCGPGNFISMALE